MNYISSQSGDQRQNRIGCIAAICPVLDELPLGSIEHVGLLLSSFLCRMTSPWKDMRINTCREIPTWRELEVYSCWKPLSAPQNTHEFGQVSQLIPCFPKIHDRALDLPMALRYVGPRMPSATTFQNTAMLCVEHFDVINSAFRKSLECSQHSARKYEPLLVSGGSPSDEGPTLETYFVDAGLTQYRLVMICGLSKLRENAS